VRGARSEKRRVEFKERLSNIGHDTKKS